MPESKRPLRVGIQLPEVEREVRWPEYIAMAKAANGRPAIPYGVAIAVGGLFVAINLY